MAVILFPGCPLGEKRDPGNEVALTVASHRFWLAALDAWSEKKLRAPRELAVFTGLDNHQAIVSQIDSIDRSIERLINQSIDWFIDWIE